MISTELLRRYPHFAGVSEECLKAVAMITDQRSFKEGDCIFAESGSFLTGALLYEKGGEATHLLILTSGQVDIVFEFPDKRQVVVGTLVAGDLMALSALIEPYRLTASGIAKVDGEMIQIEAQELRRLCDENPSLGYHLMKSVAQSLSDRLSQTRVQLAGQS